MADTIDLAAVWMATTEELADEIISAQQRAYLRLTRLRAIVEDTALLSVPDAFTRDVIESRLRPAITEALSRRLGRAVQVAVTVRPPDDAQTRPTGTGYPSASEPSGRTSGTGYQSVGTAAGYPGAADPTGGYGGPNPASGYGPNPPSGYGPDPAPGYGGQDQSGGYGGQQPGGGYGDPGPGSGYGPEPLRYPGNPGQEEQGHRNPDPGPDQGGRESGPFSGSAQQPIVGSARPPGRPADGGRPNLIPASRDGQETLFSAPYPEPYRPTAPHQTDAVSTNGSTTPVTPASSASTTVRRTAATTTAGTEPDDSAPAGTVVRTTGRVGAAPSPTIGRVAGTTAGRAESAGPEMSAATG